MVQPTLGLSCIAGAALEKGHDIQILDLSAREYDHDLIRQKIMEFKPDVVGITATTPLMNQLRDISVLIKDISKNIAVVGGGAHPSALPYETMKESMLDAIFVGESDWSFAEYLDSNDPSGVLGLYHRDGDEPVFTGWRPLTENLDDLPMPAWHLYDLNEYRVMSKLYARRTPITMVEFSRGCVFKCNFCASKVQMGMGYRKKSPERCAEEVKRLYEIGFREFTLADDIFTSDNAWATKVCDAIIASDVDMIWTASNGIRVESANDELFTKMRDAGCYRVAFGFESGNDAILKAFGKGGKASIEQGEVAIKSARSAKLDTAGFFLLGLSDDTEETMNDTIQMARKLPLDILKFGITIAFPGTTMFNDGVKNDMIRSYDWDNYHVNSAELLFSHRHLSFDKIVKNMDIAYKRAVFHNPRFWLQRLIRGIKTFDIVWDFYYFFKVFFSPTSSESYDTKYYARNRWPTWDFFKNRPRPAQYQKVGSGELKNIDMD